MITIKNHVVGTKITTIVLEIDMKKYKENSTYVASESAFEDYLGRTLNRKLKKLFTENINKTVEQLSKRLSDNHKKLLKGVK